MTSARPLDHLVLPDSGLENARERLTALGFAVAPNGNHPFGTANCCVYFDDGTFLEPLAVADAAMATATAGAGNVFTRHALDFQARNGPQGFSALVYGTGDATGDHGAFVDAGYSAGDILNFGRDFVTADGARDRAEFRLAFALQPDAPDCLFFTCERVTVPKVDRSALLKHRNGVSGITGVVMVVPDPAAMSDIAETVSGARAQATADGMALRSGDFTLEIETPMAFADRTGLPAPDSDGAQFAAVVLACEDTNQLTEHLLLSGIEFNWTPAGVIVPAGSGQGTAFIFLSQDSA